MIYLIHRGWGGRYTNYVSQNIKSICRMRRMELTQFAPTDGGYKVVISDSGVQLDDSCLKSILGRPKVSFYIGDSKGIPKEIVENADIIVSVSGLKINHQLQAMILTNSIEQTLLNHNTLRV